MSRRNVLTFVFILACLLSACAVTAPKTEIAAIQTTVDPTETRTSLPSSTATTTLTPTQTPTLTRTTTPTRTPEVGSLRVEGEKRMIWTGSEYVTLPEGSENKAVKAAMEEGRPVLKLSDVTVMEYKEGEWVNTSFTMMMSQEKLQQTVDVSRRITSPVGWQVLDVNKTAASGLVFGSLHGTDVVGIRYNHITQDYEMLSIWGNKYNPLKYFAVPLNMVMVNNGETGGENVSYYMGAMDWAGLLNLDSYMRRADSTSFAAYVGYKGNTCDMPLYPLEFRNKCSAVEPATGAVSMQMRLEQMFDSPYLLPVPDDDINEIDFPEGTVFKRDEAAFLVSIKW